MKRWWLALLLGLPLWAGAQAAFELDIDAPEEIRTLLGAHLELLRYRELTDLSDNELARLLISADKNAQDLLATLGYFAPVIEITPPPPDPDGTATRRVKLRVAPGAPTLVHEVDIRFSGAITNDPLPLNQRQQIEERWTLQPGIRFTQTEWAAAKQQALRQLTTRRFPAGRLATSLADIDPATHSARLALTLDSGPIYRLGALVISGNQRYNTTLVTRLTRLQPGALYEQTQLIQAQRRLSDSGYFNSAFVSIDTTGDPQAAPVQVQLREAPLQKLVLGVGASTDRGARLSVEHTHHQLPLLGWQALSKLQLDGESRLLSTELTAPPDADYWRWAVLAQLQREPINTLNVDSQRLRVGRSQIGERIDRTYYLQYDRTSSASATGGAPVLADALSVNYAFTLRQFDSLPFPSSGWGLGVEVGGGSTLGAQRQPYGRFVARGLSFHPLGDVAEGGLQAARAGRLALRAEAGAVLGPDGISLPSTQLFLTGGDTSVRGYAYRDIGVTQTDGSVNAGRYMTLASVEWQRPLLDARGRLSDWESTLFLDAGAVADTPGALQAKVGVGVGARWRSPVGPLQIDLAYGVQVRRFRLHLNVGFNF